MYLGRVVGKVWATVKSSGLDGQRLLIVENLTPDQKPTGRRVVCTDSMGAGAGELVYWVKGKEASFPYRPAWVATDMCIVGIVDSIDSLAARPEEKKA